MKTTKVILLSLLLYGGLNAQTGVDNICMEVVGSSGLSAVKSGRFYAWTIGQPIIATISGPDNTITQGFHQPECGTVGTDQDDLINQWGIAVFPNPTTRYLMVTFDGLAGRNLEGRVFNAIGQIQSSNLLLADPAGSRIECSGWSPGLYFLELHEPISEKSAVVKIIKITE